MSCSSEMKRENSQSLKKIQMAVKGYIKLGTVKHMWKEKETHYSLVSNNK